MSDENEHSASPEGDAASGDDPGLWAENTKDYGQGFAQGSDDEADGAFAPEPAEALNTEADEPRPAPSIALSGPVDVFGGPTALDLGTRPLAVEDTTFDGDSTLNESTRVDVDLAAALKAVEAGELGGATEPIPIPTAAPPEPTPAADPFEMASAQMTTPDVLPAASEAVPTTADAPKPLSDIEATPEVRRPDIAPEPEEEVDISSTTDDVRADLSDEHLPPPEALPASREGPKGTLVLEDSDISADPASLPPAFPQATTGDVLDVSVPLKAPAPPAPPEPDLPAQPDDWAGYDDSGGWHSITGESQIVMVEPEPMEAAPSPAGPAVFDSSADLPGEELAQLIGIQGADKGRRHSLSGDEALIGRSSRCTIVLAEPSVSRQHGRIEKRSDGFYVVDLDSGNGTFINGQRVSEERIYSGDEITFGNGTFQFVETGDRFEPVDPSAAPIRFEEPRAGPPPAFSRPLALAVASAVMLLVVGGVIITLQVSESRRNEALNQAFRRWRAGVKFFKTQDWNQAEALFHQALEVVPDHKRSLRYLDALRREREAEKLISEADTALRQNELEVAYRLSVRASESVAYGSRANEVLREVDRIVDRRVERAREALRAGRLVLVTKELQGLEFIEPYRREISKLRASEGPAEPVAAPERPPKKGKGAAEDSRTGRATQTRTDESRALDAFARGDLRAAREIATDAGLRDTAATLNRFATNRENGGQALRAKRAQAAIKPLEAALAAENRLTRGRSPFAKELRDNLSRAYYLRAVEYFNAKRYAPAFESCRQSLHYDRENGQTRRLVNILAQRATEVLQQADSIARSDRRRARELYTTVTRMVPSSDAAHRRARAALKRLR